MDDQFPPIEGNKTVSFSTYAFALLGIVLGLTWIVLSFID